MILLLRYYGDWSFQTVAHMGQFRVCILAVLFDLSGFNFGPLLLASLKLIFSNYMMILLRPGDVLGGQAIYLLVVCLTGSMAYGCWVCSILSFYIIVKCYGSLKCICVCCCYVRGFCCIMLLATIFLADQYLSFL
ncbi:hypothetical protein AMTRI_Chr05g60290 [Amborella trichopoda]